MEKHEIYEQLISMEGILYSHFSTESEGVPIDKYLHLVNVDENGTRIWSDALQTAINENAHVVISASEEPYYIDKSILIPSGRHIEAENGAVIRLKKDTKTLLMRNENNENGTYERETFENPDTNIYISGGRWEEVHNKRRGYGGSGMYDAERSYYGVSTCMFFNNVKNLILENLVIANAGGFGIQMGNVRNVVVSNVEFENCFADGVHINGNTEKIYINNVRGQVGDDLVALNMYDWQDSSVDFGPIRTVWCENLNLYSDSRYKALRISPGMYYYKDGSSVDCSLNDAVIKNVKGINTFKLYYQTRVHKLDEEVEPGGTGTGNNIYFEDITVDLDEPIDNLKNYSESDPVTGSIAAFEIGANIGNLYFENIKVELHRDKYPMSFLMCIGPKTSRIDDLEIFDPEISSEVENVYLKNVSVNSGDTFDAEKYIHEIVFNDIYGDGKAVGKGRIKNITVLN